MWFKKKGKAKKEIEPKRKRGKKSKKGKKKKKEEKRKIRKIERWKYKSLGDYDVSTERPHDKKKKKRSSVRSREI